MDLMTIFLIENNETRYARIVVTNNAPEEIVPGFGVGPENQMLYDGIRALSRYVGMTDPGPAAILRKIEVSQNRTKPDPEFQEGVRLHTLTIGNLEFISTALVNRHVNIDSEITLAVDRISDLALPKLLEGTKVLIVGFGTLGKVIFEIFASKIAKKIEVYILTTHPKSVGDYLSLKSLLNIDVTILSSYDLIPQQVDLVFFTASPKIHPEDVKNITQLESDYRSVYIKLLLEVEEKTRIRKGFFYPSSTYIDEEPVNFRIYSRVKRESEILLLSKNEGEPSAISIVRLPAFASRHHSVLIRTAGEKTVEEITQTVSEKMKKWLEALQLLGD
jgi:hypothetical protein